MKRMEPFYYIIALAGLFILAGVFLFAIQLLPQTEQAGVTIEPQEAEEGGTLYDLWFTSAEIYDLSIDHGLSGILFSSAEDKVTLLDKDRRLRWDLSFSAAPEQAKISSCGNYMATGTRDGELLFMSTDQEYYWEDKGLPVDKLAVSPNANWVTAARSDSEQGAYKIELFDRAGDLKWSIDSGPVENLYLLSEYLEQANIFYTYLDGDQPVISALNLDGEELWSYEKQSLIAVSRHGSRLAAIQDKTLIVYDSLGKELWDVELPFEPTSIEFNPQNYNRLLVYGDEEGTGENLYYFDLTDDLLWNRRIADGALLSFTADGEHILTSSWRHYREDYTQMKILNRHGEQVNSWEVAMRIEKLKKSGHPHLVVVSGEDGYIDLVNIEPMLVDNDSEVLIRPVYNPVSTGNGTNENKVTLYFIDENANLVPVNRSVSVGDKSINTAVAELIKGPARGSALYRTIPEKDDTIDVDFDEENGLLELELSSELADISGTVQSTVALDSLILTVSSFAEVEEIYLMVDGEIIEVFGEEITLEQPLKPHRWEEPVYIPVMSGNRYYLKIDEAGQANEDETDLNNKVEQSLHACRRLPFVPTDLSLLDLKISEDKSKINLSSTFKDAFPKDGGEQAQLQAELLLDALFMTVFENSRTQRVEILVEGESWTPPDGYPSLKRFFLQQYYINPEQ